MLAALEVEVNVSGSLPGGGMVICNHLGYLDVLVIAAHGPAVFVSTTAVRKWPIIGKLLERAGAILAERGNPRSAGKTAAEISEALANGLPVILFPEGTSSDGSSVLPFKPTLLQAALDSRAEVWPAAIIYEAVGGDMATDMCYWGDAVFLPHIIRLAGLKRASAWLAFGEAIPRFDDRKLAAKRLHSEVSLLLAELKSDKQ